MPSLHNFCSICLAGAGKLVTGMTQSVEVVRVVNEEFHAIIMHNYVFHDIGQSGKNGSGLPQNVRERLSTM